MPGWKWLLGALVLFLWGCSHGGAAAAYESSHEPEEGVRFKGSTLSARIWVLIGRGEFAEAQALIEEGTASGLLSKPAASRMLEEIGKLTTRLGDLPARLQRAPDFPSQLKDRTLYQIEQMLKAGDFSLATQAQMQMAQKLIRQTDRLMQKY